MPIADDGEHDSQRSRAQPGSGRRLHPGSFIILERKAEALIPSGCPPSRLRTGGHPSDFTFHERTTDDTITTPSRVPPGFRPGPGPCRVHRPRAESGAVEAHGANRALVSSEARLPGRFTLHAV
jgi:hypothetical protein